MVVSVETFLVLWQQIIHFRQLKRTWQFIRRKYWLMIPSLYLFFFLRIFVIYFISLRDLQSEEYHPGKYRTSSTRFDQNLQLFMQSSTLNPLHTEKDMPSEETQVTVNKTFSSQQPRQVIGRRINERFEKHLSMFSSSGNISLMTTAEMFVESLVHSPFNHLTWLLVRKSFIKFSSRENLKGS